MYKNLKKIINRILEIISEIERYDFYKKNLVKTTEKLYKEYQDGKYSYEEYKKLLHSVLKGKSKKEWIEYYSSYIYSLLKQIEPLLSQIIYSVYRDKSADYLEIAEAKPREKARIELEEEKEEAPAAEYDFVEVKRPSMIARLREAIKPKEMPAEAEEAEEAAIKAKARKRRVTEEEIEKRKSFLSSLAESLKAKPEKVRAKARKSSLFSRISDYLFVRDVEKRKKRIKKKIEKAKKPSLFSRLHEALSSRLIKAEKARPVRPVKPGREPLLSRIRLQLITPEIHERKKHAGKEELPPLLKPERPVRKFFSNISMKLRMALFKLLPSGKAPKAAPLPPKKKRMFFEALKGAVKPKERKEAEIMLRPEEDKALKKLVDNVDRINKEISTLRVEEAGESLNIKMKLMLIRFHFFMRRILGAKAPERAAVKKKERIPAPKPLKKPVSFMPSLKRMSSAAAAAVTKPYKMIKRTYAWLTRPTVAPEKIVKHMPEEKPEKVAMTKTEAPPAEKKPKVRIAASLLAPIKAWYRRLSEEKKRILGKKTFVPHSMQVEALKKKIVPVFEEEKIAPTLLTEEVEKIKGIMEQKKRFEIYQPSYFGSVANTLVRRFTFYLIDRFPAFFKRLYDSLRLANIKVLSNTYVNIMMFSVVLSFVISLTLFSFFFLFVRNPFFIIIPKAMVMAIIISSATFILFYMYPSIKAKAREKSINTNLPFAINHVSAVAGSGVPPTKMFKLLVESEEYGEIASELGKVVEYVELFGYDLLTAIRSVSLTVPSEALKEFLEGIVSTIESGSEIKDYLKQKAAEAMLAYELERQKYLETISTYSDVYTGILIAAPLFFIVALSLVSMLGGTIGGLEINLVIVLGAYVIIPLMNILFIIFIELTQPEV